MKRELGWMKSDSGVEETGAVEEDIGVKKEIGE